MLQAATPCLPSWPASDGDKAPAPACPLHLRPRWLTAASRGRRGGGLSGAVTPA